MAGQYDSLVNNFNLLNAEFAKTLRKKECLSKKEFAHQYENIREELKTLHHSLGLLSMQMEELIEKMREESPIDASRYSVIQGSVQTEVAKRANDLQAYLVPFFDRAPDDVKRVIFAFLPFEDLAGASATTSQWQQQTKDEFTTRSKQEVEQALAKAVTNHKEIHVIAYKLTLRGEITRAVEMLQTLPTEKIQSDFLDGVVTKLLWNGKIERAIELTRAFPHVPVRAQCIAVLVEGFLKRNEIERALRIGRELPETHRRDALLRICAFLANHGQPEQAVIVMMDIDRPPQNIIRVITDSFVKQGKIGENVKALLSIGVIDERELKQLLVRVIFPVLISKGDFETAIDFALLLPDEYHSRLYELNDSLMQHEEIAIQMFERFPEFNWPLSSLHRIAIAKATSGKIDEAFSIGTKILLKFGHDMTIQEVEDIRIQRELPDDFD